MALCNLCCCTPGHYALKGTICVICILIFAMSACIALSIPFTTTDYYSYAAEIQFNEGMFTGSVNDFSVHKIISLRLGNWAPSYTDSRNPDVKMPGALLGYTVDITKDSSTRTIVPKLYTIFLIIHFFFFLSTLSTCFHIYLPKQWTKRWVFEIIIFVISLASFFSNLWLFSFVQTEMQKLGETIVTNEGPAFFLIWIVDFFVIIVAILNRRLAKEIAKPTPNADGKGPKTYQWRVNNPASLQQASSVSPAQLSPAQRVQALMPPRITPAAQQQVQAPAPNPASYAPQSGYNPYARRPRARHRPPPPRRNHLAPSPTPAASIHSLRSISKAPSVHEQITMPVPRRIASVSNILNSRAGRIDMPAPRSTSRASSKKIDQSNLELEVKAPPPAGSTNNVPRSSSKPRDLDPPLPPLPIQHRPPGGTSLNLSPSANPSGSSLPPRKKIPSSETTPAPGFFRSLLRKGNKSSAVASSSNSGAVAPSSISRAIAPPSNSRGAASRAARTQPTPQIDEAAEDSELTYLQFREDQNAYVEIHGQLPSEWKVFKEYRIGRDKERKEKGKKFLNPTIP